MRAAPVEVRFERKFVISGHSLKEVLAIVRFNKALFREIYQERAINNIYFDTADLRNYWENVEGATYRKKARVRWYGSLDGPIAKPVLEFKIRRGLPGCKESYPLPAFELAQQSTYWPIPDLFEKARLPDEVRHELRYLTPALINRYHRRYFQSADGLFRTTIDYNLQFYGVRGHRVHFLCKCRPIANMVLEIKYAPEHDATAELISKSFPFRLNRMSKYITGVEALNGC